MYSIEGLKHGIEGCEKSIKVFEEAIEKERQTIAEWIQMIEDLKKGEEDGNSDKPNSKS